jgi:outer membrane lipoprotein-sorting protein
MVGLPPSSPLPPKRPQDVAAMPSTGTQTASAVPLAPAPAPVQVAARTAPLPASPEAAIARVNGFFNTIDLMTADFTQESASGQRTEGSLYIKHPGQLRFAYSPPSTLEIVSDGRSVAIRDKKLGTNDVYSANQTPLKFLLQERFDLARDTKVQDVQVRQDGTILVSFEDSATIGGTSKVTLIFDSKANKLKQWVIIDPQGYKTTVALSNVDVTPKGNQAAQ